jgi:hypothetical protein
LLADYYNSLLAFSFAAVVVVEGNSDAAALLDDFQLVSLSSSEDFGEKILQEVKFVCGNTMVDRIY